MRALTKADLQGHPWPGAAILARGAPYRIIGGYHTSDQREVQAGRQPRLYAAACAGRHGVYPMKWEQGPNGAWDHPILDLQDPATLAHFKVLHLDIDVPDPVPRWLP